MPRSTFPSHAFERGLAISSEHLEFSLEHPGAIPWLDYELNPRRLRGSDFLMRWSQGQWTEHRLREAVERTSQYFAVPYGPSSTAPDGDVREYELYFERLEAAGLGSVKRPDLLIFRAADKKPVFRAIKAAGGVENLPFRSERTLHKLLDLAVLAVECEHSLWLARKMPGFNVSLKPQKYLNGKVGPPKSAILPTIIIKNEDRLPLKRWERANRIPIHIWHAFFDKAYGISLKELESHIRTGRIPATRHVYQAPGGTSQEKVIYKIWYQLGYELATTTKQPKLRAAHLIDKNGHILPYVVFENGAVRLTDAAMAVLESLS